MRRPTLLLVLSSVLFPAFAGAATEAAPVVGGPVVPGTDPSTTPGLFHRDIRFKSDLGRQGDLALVGVFGSAEINFSIPETWDVKGNPELHLSLARSSMLIPDVSSITVWLDGRPVQSFYLDGPPGQLIDKTIALPVQNESGFHRIEFVGYHRSRLPCEINDHPGLWSRILADSWISVDYAQKAPELSLSRWPFPFADQRNPDAGRLNIVVPEQLTEPEAQAIGYIASFLGRSAGWRPLDIHVHQGTVETAPGGHILLVGRVDQPSSVTAASMALLDAAADEGVRAVGADTRGGRLPNAGVLALTPRPDDPHHAILSVLGRDGEGLLQLARLLSSTEGSKLPTGSAERVEEVKSAPAMAARDWSGTIPSDPSFTLGELGLRAASTSAVPGTGVTDLMAQGYRGGTVTIPLHLVPDDRPIAGGARLELIYSYSAQADPDKSRVDVFLNGAAAGGLALKEIDGQNRARLLLELPAHEMGPESRLDIVFTLLPREEPTCIGNEREAMWGTVHADSTLTLPRDQWAGVPDLGLLRFGAFPFGIRADMSETLFVLTARPSRTELQLFAWLAAEFGRVTRGDRFAYGLKMGSFDRTKDAGKDLIVVESGPDGALIKKLGLLDKMSFTPKGAPGVSVALASGGLVALGADPKVAYIEEMNLPWEEPRTAIVAYAADATLFERVGRCLSGASLFDRLRGRVTRVASCVDLAVIPGEARRVMGSRPMRQGAYEPIRNNYWLIIGVISVFIILTMAGRSFLLAWRQRQPGGEELPEQGGQG